MKRSERHMIYEGAAWGLAGCGLAFAVPTLISEHESVALLAGGMLVMAWAGWGLFYFYRVTTKG